MQSKAGQLHGSSEPNLLFVSGRLPTSCDAGINLFIGWEGVLLYEKLSAPENRKLRSGHPSQGDPTVIIRNLVVVHAYVKGHYNRSDLLRPQGLLRIEQDRDQQTVGRVD